jgi:phosphotransferase system enzyme I (PtsI)
MVETPAAVLCAEELGKVVNFFSIGTNDLTQYIMAADRGNPALADLCDTAQDAVQKALALTIESAHKDGIEAGICGEYAATDSSTERLLQMGMDYFSVAPPSVRKIKRNIRNCH